MHGPMRLASTPGLPPRPLLLLVVLVALASPSPSAVANIIKKLDDSLGPDTERYALLTLDPAGRAAGVDPPSIALPRRITAKSVFIAPSARPRCDDGYERDASGTCVRRINVDPDNAWSFFVGKLNDKFGALDPGPQTQAEAQAAAEAVEAVVVATQVAAEPAPAEEPLHFHIPIESVPEVTTEAPSTETTTVPTTTESVQDETSTNPAPTTPSFEPEVILVDDKAQPLPLSMAPVVVPDLDTATEASTTWAPTTRPAATRPPPTTSYAVKSADADADADPMINSVSDSPLLAGLKKFAPIVVAELPNFPTPSASAGATAPLDASAVPPRRRPSSSFVRFPETTSSSVASKPFVFPRDDDDDPPPPPPPPRTSLFPGLSRNAGRRFTLGRTH